jgi:hypothetical protein
LVENCPTMSTCTGAGSASTPRTSGRRGSIRSIVSVMIVRASATRSRMLRSSRAMTARPPGDPNLGLKASKTSV